MNILKENKFARDMLTIATIGTVLAGMFGAWREDEENKRKALERQNEVAMVYEVPE